jgi:hypothetical protein
VFPPPQALHNETLSRGDSHRGVDARVTPQSSLWSSLDLIGLSKTVINAKPTNLTL